MKQSVKKGLIGGVGMLVIRSKGLFEGPGNEYHSVMQCADQLPPVRRRKSQPSGASDELGVLSVFFNAVFVVLFLLPQLFAFPPLAAKVRFPQSKLPFDSPASRSQALWIEGAHLQLWHCAVTPSYPSNCPVKSVGALLISFSTPLPIPLQVHSLVSVPAT